MHRKAQSERARRRSEGRLPAWASEGRSQRREGCRCVVPSGRGRRGCRRRSSWIYSCREMARKSKHPDRLAGGGTSFTTVRTSVDTPQGTNHAQGLCAGLSHSRRRRHRLHHGRPARAAAAIRERFPSLPRCAVQRRHRRADHRRAFCRCRRYARCARLKPQICLRACTMTSRSADAVPTPTDSPGTHPGGKPR